ncbi:MULTISPECIES: cupin domain-containing protein [Providencia]|uniref:Cupin domain-containing protein n=1 Tax=Providencia huashanensis TaxID=3037798 RepID=A0AA42K2N1_9GAMM|nr:MULTISPECIES: cupin domain-containing protein [Providencia]MBC8652670.1 cupin domain-containing protein [Providencia vermicola]HCI95775.1 cupin domain-containing protein [Providencia sp.]APC13291.1 Cupin domain protein [Providencia rettgeri]AVL72668.1 cupin domain-containing protein [Providencia rettgeri]EIL1981634.1 cupin domain-containing protein [Providencia rettgeri]
MSDNTITPSEALTISTLINYTEQGIASRVLAKNTGGNMTLFAFDKGQALSEHSAPFDAIVMVVEGSLLLTIEGKPVTAKPGEIVRMPANIPHAVDAPEPAKMLLVMLREPNTDCTH